MVTKVVLAIQFAERLSVDNWLSCTRMWVSTHLEGDQDIRIERNGLDTSFS